jgi:hypothetical protein
VLLGRLALLVLAVVVAVANVATGLALWRSHSFDRWQKIAQSCLMWFIPGAFVIVQFAIRDSVPGDISEGPTSDPTVSREHGYYADDPTAFNHGPGDGGHG